MRARQTAQPVGERAGLEVAVDQCLLDRDYGPWTGISRESVTDRWGSVDRAPGVEPRPAVRDRAVQGLTGIARRHPGGTVVVVSHDAVNREVLAALDAGLGDPDAIPQDNGCYDTLEWRGRRWAVLGVRGYPSCSCPRRKASSPYPEDRRQVPDDGNDHGTSTAPVLDRGCRLSRCVTIACCGQGARSALLQTRYGAGIGREPTTA